MKHHLKDFFIAKQHIKTMTFVSDVRHKTYLDWTVLEKTRCLVGMWDIKCLVQGPSEESTQFY